MIAPSPVADDPSSLRHVAFTGGGSAGHVIPSLPLIDALLTQQVKITYVGSTSGLEAEVLGHRLPAITYQAIASGKLRRYFSLENVTDIGRVLRGLWQAFRCFGGDRALRPQVLFSKGGFVSLPVVWAAWLRGIPVVAHESDQTPGLANRLALPFLHTLCTNFADTRAKRLRGRLVQTGTPLRTELLQGEKSKGRQFLALGANEPLLVITGGSLGAEALNTAVREALPELTRHFAVVHLCGRGKVDSSIDTPRYQQFDYLSEPWGDVLAAADVVVSRAGANSLLELIALGKPNLLVPLPLAVSRGDQVENAAYARERGYSLVLSEAELTRENLVAAVLQLYTDRSQWQAALADAVPSNALTKILKQLSAAARVVQA